MPVYVYALCSNMKIFNINRFETRLQHPDYIRSAPLIHANIINNTQQVDNWIIASLPCSFNNPCYCPATLMHTGSFSDTRFDLMKKSSGLLGALNVKIAQLLVMQRSPSAALRFHADQVSGEKLFDTFWVDFNEVFKV